VEVRDLIREIKLQTISIRLVFSSMVVKPMNQIAALLIKSLFKIQVRKVSANIRSMEPNALMKTSLRMLQQNFML